MKKILPILAIAALSFLTACPAGESEDAQAQTADYANMVELSLKEQGLPVKMMVPNEDVARGVPVVKFIEELGYFEVAVGPNFKLQILEEEGDIASIKSEADNNSVFNTEYVEETPERLVFKQTLKGDPSHKYHHFYTIKEIGGNTYVIKDDAMGEFTKLHVERMLKAIDSMEVLAAS